MDDGRGVATPRPPGQEGAMNRAPTQGSPFGERAHQKSRPGGRPILILVHVTLAMFCVALKTRGAG